MFYKLDKSNPLYIQAVGAEGYRWETLNLQGTVSDQIALAEEIARQDFKVMNTPLDELMDLSIEDFSFPSEVKVRGLVDNPPFHVGTSDKPKAGRVYNPVEECPHLFRTFSELELSEKVILDFANLYGPIYRQRQMGYLDGDFIYYEAYEDYCDEIVFLKRALDLYDAFSGFEDKHFKRQQELLNYDDRDKGTVALNYEPRNSKWNRLLFRRDYSEKVWERAKSDFRVMFQLFFREMLNEKLKTHVSFEVGVCSQEFDEELEFESRPVPYNLIGALWLQVLMMAERKVVYRHCDFCGKAIEVPPNSRRSRSDKAYCVSDPRTGTSKCRSNAYNARKTRALKMSS